MRCGVLGVVPSKTDRFPLIIILDFRRDGRKEDGIYQENMFSWIENIDPENHKRWPGLRNDV